MLPHVATSRARVPAYSTSRRIGTNRLDGALAPPKQVEVAGRPVRAVRPEAKKHGQGGPGEPRDAQSWVVQPGTPRLLGQRQPHLGRELRRQIVEGQGAEQAHDSPGHAFRHLRQGVVRRAPMPPRHVPRSD
jgi:hypothetical protein